MPRGRCGHRPLSIAFARHSRSRFAVVNGRLSPSFIAGRGRRLSLTVLHPLVAPSVALCVAPSGTSWSLSARLHRFRAAATAATAATVCPLARRPARSLPCLPVPDRVTLPSGSARRCIAVALATLSVVHFCNSRPAAAVPATSAHQSTPLKPSPSPAHPTLQPRHRWPRASTAIRSTTSPPPARGTRPLRESLRRRKPEKDAGAHRARRLDGDQRVRHRHQGRSGINYTSNDTLVARRNVAAAGAIIANLPALLDTLKAHHVLPIARIVVFKDSVAARANSAVDDPHRSRGTWRDKKGAHLGQPMRPRALWEYGSAWRKTPPAWDSARSSSITSDSPSRIRVSRRRSSRAASDPSARAGGARRVPAHPPAPASTNTMCERPRTSSEW